MAAKINREFHPISKLPFENNKNPFPDFLADLWADSADSFIWSDPDGLGRRQFADSANLAKFQRAVEQLSSSQGDQSGRVEEVEGDPSIESSVDALTSRAHVPAAVSSDNAGEIARPADVSAHNHTNAADVKISFEADARSIWSEWIGERERGQLEATSETLGESSQGFGDEGAAANALATSTQGPTATTLDAKWNLKEGAGGINVTGVWPEFTGKGIKVGIVDDGFDYKHAELSSSYDLSLDYDARDKDFDAWAAKPADKHGTAVAGLITADPNSSNSNGMVGVAYDSTIVGFRMGYGSSGSVTQIWENLRRLDGQYYDAYGKLVKGTSMDVANNSWGYSSPFSDDFGKNSGSAIGLDDCGVELKSNAMFGRGGDVATGTLGLGVNTVFAAGNGRGEGDNVNYHNFINSPYTIAVAATDANGKVASFSTPGAAVHVSAGGANVYTTDRTGTQGYSSTDYATVNGTSFAAPTVSGVIALMLDANPDLGYRDVQEILAYSAKQTGGSTGWAVNGATNWNGGGLHFSHDYGFGLVDATAAVRLAESWQGKSIYKEPVTLNDAVTGTGGSGGAIKYGSTLTSSIKVGDLVPGGTPDSLTIDKILVDLNISHTYVQDLTVTLTHVSVNGTRTEAVLIANPKTSSGTGGGIVFTTSANNFWGEDTTGEWTLSVSDNYSLDDGRLNSWSLRAIGDAPTSDDVYVFTNEYKAGGTLKDGDDGIDTINLAAVTGRTTLDLASKTATVDGKDLTLDGVFEKAWLGDGNDTVLGNDLANVFNGGRGNDIIAGRAGKDIIDGGAGIDTANYSEKTTAVVVTLNGPNDAMVTVGGVSEDTLRNIENLTGGSANDTLTGDGFANVLTGGLGADNLWGGLGSDMFVFRLVDDSPGSASDLTWDLVWDFQPGDLIDLSLLKWDGVHTFTWADANDTYSAGELWLEGSFLFGEVNEAAAGAEFKIQLANTHSFTQGDVFLVA